MRRLFLIFLLAPFLGVPAAAEDWRLVSQDGFSKIYLDPASRQPLADGAIQVRALTDYDPASPEAGPFKLSEKGLSEIESAQFDCTKKSYRSGGGRWFAGPMATGAARSDYPAKDAWAKVPSFYAALAAKVCGAP